MEFANRRTFGMVLMGLGILLVLVLGFAKYDYDLISTALCAETAKVGAEMLQCPAHTNDASWLFSSAFVLSFFVLLAGAYLAFFEHLARPKKSFKSVDAAKLSPDEKKVYELLLRKEGSVFQGELVSETGFSKVKLSRVLDGLERAEIVERKRRGMSNLVVLK